MKLISVGKKVINLRHMIIKEEWEGEPDDPPPGVVRVTIESGRVLNLTGDRAAQFLRGLGEYFKPEQPPPGGVGELPRAVDQSAEETPPPSTRRRKPKGNKHGGVEGAPDQDRA